MSNAIRVDPRVASVYTNRYTHPTSHRDVNRRKMQARFKLNFHMRYMRASSPTPLYLFHRSRIIPQSITIQSPRNVMSTTPYVMHVPRSIAVIKWPFESDARIPAEYGFNIQPDAHGLKSNIPRRSR